MPAPGRSRAAGALSMSELPDASASSADPGGMRRVDAESSRSRHVCRQARADAGWGATGEGHDGAARTRTSVADECAHAGCSSETDGEPPSTPSRVSQLKDEFGVQAVSTEASMRGPAEAPAVAPVKSAVRCGTPKPDRMPRRLPSGPSSSAPVASAAPCWQASSGRKRCAARGPGPAVGDAARDAQLQAVQRVHKIDAAGAVTQSPLPQRRDGSCMRASSAPGSSSSSIECPRVGCGTAATAPSPVTSTAPSPKRKRRASIAAGFNQLPAGSRGR